MTVTLSISGEKINKTFIGKSVDDVLSQANRFFIYVPPHTPIPPEAKEPHGNPEHDRVGSEPTSNPESGHDFGKGKETVKEKKPHDEKDKHE